MDRQFEWHHEPPKWCLEHDVLSVRTGRNTDFWQSTFYGFQRDDGHFFHTRVHGDFSAEVATALRNNEKIDLVYGHNDPMAYGAYLAAKDAGRDKEIKFIGIDALPGEGVTWVNKGELTATFLYATPGAEGLRQAVKHLKGEKVEKTITLDTLKVTKENAAQVLKQHGL